MTKHHLTKIIALTAALTAFAGMLAAIQGCFDAPQHDETADVRVIEVGRP